LISLASAIAILNIPIVIAAYNRKGCLERLLRSISSASYDTEVRLIISIDGGGPLDVVECANNFTWRHGDKEVIHHESNLGLRSHIMSCGQLCSKYDGIILLEDDLYVGKYFYDFAISAQRAYAQQDTIAGVALYSHQYNETACLPFVPMPDGHDVFFLQVACSWGQSWSTSQWRGFEEWYRHNQNLDLSIDPDMAPDVRLWPDTSWKKYFIKYLIDTGKFFVYPRVSHATNFGDAGVNHDDTNVFQVPLSTGRRKYSFPGINNSFSRYDAYCELLAECMSACHDELASYDLTIDLYGVKPRDSVKTEYILTTQHTSNPVRSYGRKLKPHELNIIDAIDGDTIFLCHRDQVDWYVNFLKYRHTLITDHKLTHSYFYSVRPMHYDALTSEIKRNHEQIRALRHSASACERIVRPIIRLYQHSRMLKSKIINKLRHIFS